MQNLYYSASTGDLESVRELSGHRLPGSTEWLERLADNHNAEPQARASAIEALVGRRSADPRRIAPLLWIRVPFFVRDEAAQWFLKRGCAEDCARITLNSLHALWNGQLTIEAQLYADDHSAARGSDNDVLKLMNRTEANYIALLNAAPCLCDKRLRLDYSMDPAFAKKVMEQLTTKCVN